MLKVFERSCEVVLTDGLYSLCPEQDNPQLFEGTKKSPLPVSNCTVYDTGSDSNL